MIGEHNELEIEVAFAGKSFPWLRCADQIRNQESCLAKHGNQREMSEADLTEKNKDREEGAQGGAGMER